MYWARNDQDNVGVRPYPKFTRCLNSSSRTCAAIDPTREVLNSSPSSQQSSRTSQALGAYFQIQTQHGSIWHLVNNISRTSLAVHEFSYRCYYAACQISPNDGDVDQTQRHTSEIENFVIQNFQQTRNEIAWSFWVNWTLDENFVTTLLKWISSLEKDIWKTTQQLPSLEDKMSILPKQSRLFVKQKLHYGIFVWEKEEATKSLSRRDEVEIVFPSSATRTQHHCKQNGVFTSCLVMTLSWKLQREFLNTSLVSSLNIYIPNAM